MKLGGYNNGYLIGFNFSLWLLACHDCGITDEGKIYTANLKEATEPLNIFLDYCRKTGTVESDAYHIEMLQRAIEGNMPEELMDIGLRR